MPQIEPFKGILYNFKKINIANIVAPPYDIISPHMQDDLYRIDEHNIIRLILGKEEPKDSARVNKYKRAVQFFKRWLKEKVLVQDKTPSIYVYGQEYFHETKRKKRIGFIARMKIEDPRESKVLPHEYTFAKPKEDRLNLIREVKANLSPIFTLFQDGDNKIRPILKSALKTKPVFDVEFEGVRHILWKLDKEALIKKIQALMGDKDIFIADGHHRYEVAVIYRDEMRNKTGQRSTVHGPRKNKGYDYVMIYFSPLNQEGLTILSTHRLVKGINIDIEELLEQLKVYFYIKTFKAANHLFQKMASAKKGEYAFGMYSKNKIFYLLKLKENVPLVDVIKEDKSKEWKRLDVSVLHGLIFDNILDLREKVRNEECIVYTRDPDYAISEVDKGNCTLAFFLNPTRVSQVRAIAKIGDRMPHKSTYFYPKLLSGLVINKL